MSCVLRVLKAVFGFIIIFTGRAECEFALACGSFLELFSYQTGGLVLRANTSHVKSFFFF